MRIALLLVSLTGCLFDQPDEVSADLDSFGTIDVYLQQNTSAAVWVDIYAKDVRPCPVLTDLSAKLGEQDLKVIGRGGYDDFFGECDEAAVSLRVAPEIAGAWLVLKSGESTRACDLADLYMSRPIEFLDGGSWTRPSEVRTVEFRYVDPLPLPGRPTVTVTPRGTTGSPVTLPAEHVVDDTYRMVLPILAPQVYDMKITQTLSPFSTGSCRVNATPFTSETLTIVAP